MCHNTSPIHDMYPSEFAVDMNGKRNPWEAVNLLPFIDEKRMRKAVAEHCPLSKLTEDERRRNAFGQDVVFFYDPSNSNNVASSFPEAGFPDLLCCMPIHRLVQNDVIMTSSTLSDLYSRPISTPIHRLVEKNNLSATAVSTNQSDRLLHLRFY